MGILAVFEEFDNMPRLSIQHCRSPYILGDDARTLGYLHSEVTVTNRRP